MTHHTSARKALLMLSLLVLAVHLLLLRSATISLSASAQEPLPMYFNLRTVAATPLATPVQTPVPMPVKPRPKPVRKATPRPLSAADAPTEPAGVSSPPSPEPSEPSAELADASNITALASQVQASQTQSPQPEELAEPPSSRQAPAVVASAPQTSSSVPRVSASQSAQAQPAAASSQPKARVTEEGLPGSLKLIYKVESNKFPYQLNAELLWQQDKAQYFASLRVGAFGQYRTQTSRGKVGPQGLVPERFSDKYRSEVAAHFNWLQRKASFSANTPDVLLQDGAQDRMSVLIQLAALVASAPTRYAPGTSITLQTVGPRDADLWLFSVEALEDLAVPSDPPDTLKTLKITRKPRQLYDQQMALWLSPSLNYLPARIRLQEANGDFIDQRWFATEAVDKPEMSQDTQ